MTKYKRCPSCRTDILKTLKHCPHCDEKQLNPFIKYIIIAICVFILGVGILSFKLL